MRRSDSRSPCPPGRLPGRFLAPCRAMLLILPGLCYALILTALWRSRTERDPRPALLGAALIWGLVLVGITEGLSLFFALTPLGLGLSWGIASLGAALALRRSKAQPKAAACLPIEYRCRLGLAMSAAILVVALISGSISVLGWPNTYDAMAYHLARMAHWSQDRSVAFYPTSITHQLFYPPWAEYAALHLTQLGSDVRLANLVQWPSLLGCALGV